MVLVSPVEPLGRKLKDKDAAITLIRTRHREPAARVRRLKIVDVVVGNSFSNVAAATCCGATPTNTPAATGR